MLRTPSQPFEPTIANLASDSGCSTARLLNRAELVLLRMAHRHRPRVDLLLMFSLRSQAQRQNRLSAVVLEKMQPLHMCARRAMIS